MAQMQLEISLGVVNKVRGVAGQQLRALEHQSGCALSLVRKGGGAIVEIAGADATQCEAAAVMIRNFVGIVENGGQPVLKPQTIRQPLVYPTLGNGVQSRAVNAVPPGPQPPTTVVRRPVQQAAPSFATQPVAVPQQVAGYSAPAHPQQIAGYAKPQQSFRHPAAPAPQPNFGYAAPPAPQQTPQYVPPPARPQQPVPASLVEIPLTIADQVREKAQELSTKTGCHFQVALERNRGLVRIEHPEIAHRVNARKTLNELIAVLMPPQETTYETPPVKAQTRSESRPQRRVFGFNNSAPVEELDGWNAPPETDRDRFSKEPRQVVKNFYAEHPEITAMSAQEVAEFRKENMETNVRNLGNKPPSAGIPKPIKRFEHAFETYPEILTQLRAKFEKPSPIQCQAWPILLSGRDMVGIAQTGTGKTLAFLLPAFIHIRGQPVVSKRYEGPTCLVLSPTRELAIQIYEESVKYAYKSIHCACCYGGAVRSTQMDQLRKLPEIIIATPGRLNDLVENMIVSLKKVSYLVLDEADRMLDMGFEPQIRQILHYVPDDRQTVMTSATWPTNVRRLAQSFMQDPVQVTIGSLDLSAALTVTQRVRMVRADEKYPIVLNLMKSLKPNDRAIVFCGRKMTTDVIANKLTLAGIRAESIHGDRDQREREAALRHLRTGKSKVLVATDVASRGLDVKEITVVVNYDFPQNIEEYVHRVGRTGRAGSTGSSYTLMTAADGRFCKELVKILLKAKQQIPDWLKKQASSGGYDY